MNNRPSLWLPIVGAIVLGTLIGMGAYNAGVAHGLALNGHTASGPIGWGWGAYPGFHPFGFVFPLFFLFFCLAAIRRMMWGGWRHYGTPPVWSERFDRWHREAHDRMNKPM